MPNTLCVIDDNPSLSEQRRVLRALAGDEVSLLAFSGTAATVQTLHDSCPGRVRVLDVDRLMSEAIPRARDKFIRFCADWPERFRHDGKSFKELFVHEDSLSLWWLTELSQKNTEDRPTFSHLSKIEAVRSALAATTYDSALVVAKDADLARVLLDACATAGTPARIVGRRRFRFVGSGVWLMLGRAKRFARELFRVAAVFLALPRSARRLTKSGRGDRLIAFHSWFPAHWIDWHGGLRDRYFVDLPDYLAAEERWDVIHACTAEQSRFMQLLRSLFRLRRSADEGAGHLHFLESSASLWDVIRAYADVRGAIRFSLLERTPAFRSSFRMDGVDIFPIARHDLRYSFFRDIPHYLLLAARVRNFVRAVRPAYFVTPWETYCYGRAVAYGVRRAPSGTRVVGYQHSALVSTHLVYNYLPQETRNGEQAQGKGEMPIPDIFLLHGQYARRVLQESGFPEDRLRVCGCPRFDDLHVFREERLHRQAELRGGLGVPPDKRVVLMATLLWRGATERLLDSCFSALAGRADVLLVVKAHPSFQDVAPYVQAAAARSGQQNFIISSERLNQLQAAADVMVTGMSTSLLEALVVGCPVVRLVGDGEGSEATFGARNAFACARTAGELATAIEAALSRGVTGVDGEDVVRDIYYKIDGQAKRRVAQALEGQALLGDG